MPQPMETRTVALEDGGERTGFVCYSLGNLLSCQNDEYTDISAILNIELTRDDESGETATFAYGDEEIRKHMDLFDNIVDLHDKNIVFNGYTLVKDKTAFAYGYDMQGVVLIDYDKDAANYQYSLHNAVQSALR